jgi:hypothetical protein
MEAMTMNDNDINFLNPKIGDGSKLKPKEEKKEENKK